MADMPTKAWLALYAQKSALLAPAADLNEYFTAKEICGLQMDLLPMGTVTIPTGRVLVCDPLVYLHESSGTYFSTVPTGTFPLTAAVVMLEEDHPRYAAVKLAFSDAVPVRFTEALIGNENLAEVHEGEYFGFNVDAGLGTIVDAAARDAWREFHGNWTKEHPDGNIYDDFFAEEFRKSREKHPKYQREDGDWINWTIPGTNLSIPMFQSGFGDGTYPAYFGYDKNGAICRLVIHFINIALEIEDADFTE
jgi:hypothetical protein